MLKLFIVGRLVCDHTRSRNYFQIKKLPPLALLMLVLLILPLLLPLILLLLIHVANRIIALTVFYFDNFRDVSKTTDSKMHLLTIKNTGHSEKNKTTKS